MKIGVPREIKPQENRIGLIPESVKTLISHGHEVLVENKLKDQEKYFGRTRYMTPVIFDSKTCNVGELANVKVTSINQKNLFGFHENNKIKAA